MAGDIAKLFPYRDATGKLMFRGKVGCDDSGVSLFYPYRDASGKMMLRGKGPDGCILKGWPYLAINGQLRGRTYGMPHIPIGTNGTILSILDKGGLVAFGRFSTMDGVPVYGVAHRNPSTGKWVPASDFTVQGTPNICAVKELDGRVYLASWFFKNKLFVAWDSSSDTWLYDLAQPNSYSRLGRMVYDPVLHAFWTTSTKGFTGYATSEAFKGQARYYIGLNEWEPQLPHPSCSSLCGCCLSFNPDPYYCQSGYLTCAAPYSNGTMVLGGRWERIGMLGYGTNCPSTLLPDGLAKYDSKGYPLYYYTLNFTGSSWYGTLRLYLDGELTISYEIPSGENQFTIYSQIVTQWNDWMSEHPDVKQIYAEQRGWGGVRFTLGGGVSGFVMTKELDGTGDITLTLTDRDGLAAAWSPMSTGGLVNPICMDNVDGAILGCCWWGLISPGHWRYLGVDADLPGNPFKGWWTQRSNLLVGDKAGAFYCGDMWNDEGHVPFGYSDSNNQYFNCGQDIIGQVFSMCPYDDGIVIGGAFTESESAPHPLNNIGWYDGEHVWPI